MHYLIRVNISFFRKKKRNGSTTPRRWRKAAPHKRTKRKQHRPRKEKGNHPNEEDTTEEEGQQKKTLKELLKEHLRKISRSFKKLSFQGVCKTTRKISTASDKTTTAAKKNDIRARKKDLLRARVGACGFFQWQHILLEKNNFLFFLKKKKTGSLGVAICGGCCLGSLFHLTRTIDVARFWFSEGCPINGPLSLGCRHPCAQSGSACCKWCPFSGCAACYRGVMRPTTKLRARTRVQVWTVEAENSKGLCSMVSWR